MVFPVRHYTKSTYLTFVRRPAFQMPDMSHGECVYFTNGSLKKLGEGLELIGDDSSNFEKQEQEFTELTYLSKYGKRTTQATDDAAFRWFGFDRLHPFQHRIIDRVLRGQQVLGIAATGSGKSECFILPAMILPGVTIVVSPLNSLMMDQYNQRITHRYGLDHVTTYINGDVSFNERNARLRRLEFGFYKLIYLTPEQLERPHILESLRRTNQRVGIRYMALDEAHCISQWGHDFRPSYLNIFKRMAHYDIKPICIALTATASRYVREDICEELGLRNKSIDEDGDVLIESSNRPELNLIVKVKRQTKEKIDDCLISLRKLQQVNKKNQNPGAAIVFMPYTGGDPDLENGECKPQKGRLSAKVNQFAGYIERSLQERVSIYHSKFKSQRGIVSPDEDVESDKKNDRILGDMGGRSRHNEQGLFMHGKTSVMVATKGFGMGIDKENIRLVIHRSPPANLEAYAQEAGRAGRDGEKADVILYYSPDQSEEESWGELQKGPSDYEIQKFFLDEKYIRREDVMAMYAFLRSVKRNIGNSRYFTSDEAIDFLDQCDQEHSSDFQWPIFPPRPERKQDYGFHKQILDQGHKYDQKCSYIDRILQIMYKIRPNISQNQKRVTLLEQVQLVRAAVDKVEIRNFEYIRCSNAYFGHLLRENRIDEAEFRDLLNGPDIIPLARRIKRSIYETSMLISDIRSATREDPDTRFTYIDMTPYYGSVSPLSNLEDRRNYYGAVRANRNEAYKRANQNKREKPNIDDWFGEEEISRPIGWEVTPGPAFNHTDFSSFLEAFVALHDQRKENDWAAYYRLLSDYVGVANDGAIRQGEKKQQTCLRAILLGYLQTNEVIVGGICFGCSVCVPDGRFEQYTMEQRRNAVVSINPKIERHLKEFEELIGEIPSINQQEEFYEILAESGKSGRSIEGYLRGWTIRLLDQMPGHCTALWIRTELQLAQEEGLDIQEILRNLKSLVENLPDNDLDRLEGLSQRLAKRFDGGVDLLKTRAKLAQRRHDYNAEMRLLDKLVTTIIESQENEEDLYTITERFLTLCKIMEVESTNEQFSKRLIICGHTAPDYSTSVDWYKRSKPNWEWEKFEAELHVCLRWGKSHNTAALWTTWIKESDSERRASYIVDWLKEKHGFLKEWPLSARKYLVSLLTDDQVESSDDLVESVIFSENEKRALSIGMNAMGQGKRIVDSAECRLSALVGDYPLHVCTHLSDKPDPWKIINPLLYKAECLVWNEARAWLYIVDKLGHSEEETAMQLLKVVLPVFPSESEGNVAIELLGTLTRPLLKNPVLFEEVLDMWWKVGMKDANMLRHVLDWLINSGEEGIPKTDRLLDLLIDNKKIDLLISFADQAPTYRWKRIVKFAQIANDKVRPLLNNLYDVKASDLHELRRLFDYRHDPEEADMLEVLLNDCRFAHFHGGLKESDAKRV